MVEFRPNGSYTIVQPLPKPNPASRAEKDAVSIAEKEFMGELEEAKERICRPQQTISVEDRVQLLSSEQSGANDFSDCKLTALTNTIFSW